MSIPGFNAEASLYKAKAFYNAVLGSYRLDRPKIIPQQFAECWTDTSCPVAIGLGPMLCEDKCNEFPGGPAVYESGVYPCGVCVGLSLDIF
jgi:hypothetical protein